MSATPDLLRLAALCGFSGPSWVRWRAVLSMLTPEIRELFVAAGRGSGKSRIVGLLAVALASRTYRRAPGERIYVGVFAPDRKQAAVTLGYVKGLFASRPELARMVTSEARERIDLANGVTVEVLTATAAAPRGRSYAAAIIEEAAFLPVDESSSEPDVELLRALRPGLARVPGSLLAVVSSPYRRAGILFDAVRAGSSADRLVVVADTLSLNPSFDRREVERAFAADPISAASEFGRDGIIDFRADVAALLSEAALLAVVANGVREIAPDISRAAHAHFDAATGSGSDSAALAISFAPTAPGNAAQLAALRKWKPPFSPSRVIAEAAALAKSYGLDRISIDRYAPGLVAELFAAEGVRANVAERDTSAAFVELLALVNSGLVALLDDSTLLSELRRLERRAGPSGKELVSHPSGAHDDVAAAAAHALAVAASRAVPKRRAGVWGARETGLVGGMSRAQIRRGRRDFARIASKSALSLVDRTLPRAVPLKPSMYPSPLDSPHR